MPEKNKLVMLRNRIIEYKRIIRLAEQSIVYGGDKLAITLIYQAATVILNAINETGNLFPPTLKSKVMIIKKECVKKLEGGCNNLAIKQALEQALEVIPKIDLVLFKMIKAYTEGNSAVSTSSSLSSGISSNRFSQASHPRLYSP